jgi:hypothetical protein
MKYTIGLLFFMTMSVNAAHHCVGNVTNIDVAGSSNVQVNIAGIGDGNILCALNRKLGEYEPEACKAVLGLLMAAKMANKRVRVYFRNDANTSCNKGNWVNLADSGFYYLRLED